MSVSSLSFLAVNIGNSTAQFACVRGCDPAGIPQLERVIETPSHDLDTTVVEKWLPLEEDCAWYISSVYRAADERLRAWIAERYPAARAVRLAAHNFPLSIDVRYPDRVGIDRLAAALAACRFKSPKRPACVVAISVDGRFLGGAISPGAGIAAKALDRYTDALPLVQFASEPIPDVIGKDTESAIRSGLYWGMIGTVQQLVTEVQLALGTHYVELFLTGGMADTIGRHLTMNAEVAPHLVLQGIALAVLQ
jgi:type III pantothenate kinase